MPTAKYPHLMDTEQSNLTYEDFVRARKVHWMQKATALDSDVRIPQSEKIELGEDASNFMISAQGPDGLYAVFEDSDEVGWFYIYDSLSKCILKATHVYNRSNVSVGAEDVDVGWSADGEICCVAI